MSPAKRNSQDRAGDGKGDATRKALDLLTRREHSGLELRRKLIARGLSHGDVEQAIAALRDSGWQSDTRFAEALVRSRAGNGYGPVRIHAELGTHGFDRDAISAALDSFDCDWNEQARDLVRRRFGPGIAADRALQRKAVGFLVRRGFTGDHVRAATCLGPKD